MKIISLQDVERSIKTLENFVYQELNDLTIECGKVYDKFIKFFNELKKYLFKKIKAFKETNITTLFK